MERKLVVTGTWRPSGLWGRAAEALKHRWLDVALLPHSHLPPLVEPKGKPEGKGVCQWSTLIHLPRHLPRILTHSGNRLSLQCGPCVPFLSVSLTHSRGLVKRDENESSHCWKRAHQGNLWKIKRIKPELFVFFLSTSIRFTSKPTNLMLSSNKKMVGLFTSISVFWAKFRIRNGVY